MRTPLQRRTFLRGAGVAIGLPMLEAMTPRNMTSTSRAAEKPAKPIKRFVCLSNNYGVYRNGFFPSADQAGAGYDMPETLKPLERHRKDFTVFSNLDHGNTIGHQGVPVLLSGVRPHLAVHYPEGNISVDQKIAEFVGAETRFPSMTVRVNEANFISFTRTGVQVPAIDLRGMYRALFIAESADKKATAAERFFVFGRRPPVNRRTPLGQLRRSPAAPADEIKPVGQPCGPADPFKPFEKTQGDQPAHPAAIQ